MKYKYMNITNKTNSIRYYKPKKNLKKAVVGLILIVGCVLTPMTNIAIPLIFYSFILQTPYNTDKIRQKIKYKLKSFKKN